MTTAETGSLQQSHGELFGANSSKSVEHIFGKGINTFISSPLERRPAVATTIAASLLFEPAGMIPFTRVCAAKAAEGHKIKKTVDSLHHQVRDQVANLARSNFHEIIASPERMGKLIELTMAGAQGIASLTEQEYRAELKKPGPQAYDLANRTLIMLFDEAGRIRRETGQPGSLSLEQMEEIQTKTVDLFYSIARYAVSRHDRGSRSHVLLLGAATGNLTHYLRIDQPAMPLLHTAVYSGKPELVAKAQFVDFAAHLIDQYQGRNMFDSVQDSVRDNHALAIKFKTAMRKNNPSAVEEGNRLREDMKRRLAQKASETPDDSFYLDPSTSPLEAQVLAWNRSIWYDYLHFYSAFSQAGSIPLTFPDGHFKGIGHEDGDNGPRTQRVLAAAWNTPLAQEVSDPQAIADVMTHLIPLDKTTVPSPNAIEAAATVNTAVAGQLLETGSIPVRIQIGANSFAAQIGEDGGLYLKNGESAGVSGPAMEAWSSHIAATLWPSLFAFLREHRTELSPALTPLLLKQMRPELMGVSFIELERDLRQIKETLSAPKRGLLRDGLTVKFTKGQLPAETPVTSIHYDRSGSKATVSIGNTKLEAGIDFTVPPPKVVSVNGAPFAQGSNENTWFEYVILSPLKALVCPDPRIKPEENDEVILENAQNLPLRQAIEKTIKVIHQKVGHLYLLPERDGKPTKFTGGQAVKVVGLTFPLPGVRKLYLEEYNLDPVHRPDQVNGRYWDYAVYAEETYDRHQPVKHATVTTPHAFDGFYRIRASEERARSSGAGIVE